jgi:hypothetical protein
VVNQARRKINLHWVLKSSVTPKSPDKYFEIGDFNNIGYNMCPDDTATDASWAGVGLVN